MLSDNISMGRKAAERGTVGVTMHTKDGSRGKRKESQLKEF
jgi:hypothetical protein